GHDYVTGALRCVQYAAGHWRPVFLLQYIPRRTADGGCTGIDNNPWRYLATAIPAQRSAIRRPSLANLLICHSPALLYRHGRDLARSLGGWNNSRYLYNPGPRW